MAMTEKRSQQIYSYAKKLYKTLGDRDEWTAKDATPIIGCTPHGTGAILNQIAKTGLIRRIAQGQRYALGNGTSERRGSMYTFKGRELEMSNNDDMFSGLRKALEGKETWTASEVAQALGIPSRGLGSKLKNAARQGVIHVVREYDAAGGLPGVYSFNPSTLVPLMQTTTPPAATSQYGPPITSRYDSSLTPAPNQRGPVFITSGPRFVNPAAIAFVETDDRGSVSVVLTIQETRAKDGVIAPVEFCMDGEEAAMFISGLSVACGTPDATERVVKLEAQNTTMAKELAEYKAVIQRLETERDTALQLAEQSDKAARKAKAAMQAAIES